MAEGATVSQKSVKYLLWTLLAELLLLLVLIPNHWLQKVVDKENDMLRSEMGRPSAEWVIDKGESWYDTLFVETGINYEVYRFFIPSQQERAASKGMENLGATSWFPWVEGRGDALATILQQSLQRIALLKTWMLFFILMVIPFVWDGLMAWKIKQYSFRHASTATHSMAMTSIGVITLGTLIGLFVPAPLPPVAIPIMMMMVMISLNLVVRHAQKEI